MNFEKKFKLLAALSAKSCAIDASHSIRESEIFKNTLTIACGAATSAAKQLSIDVDVMLYILAVSLSDKAISSYNRKDG